MPTLDVDITDEAAAKACEKFVRERYGYVLTRIGKPPKFAIPFRTEEPFEKITVNLIAPDGGSEGQKIEFLGDGQQVVVDGIHPETKQSYRWSNGGLEQLKHEHLHDIGENEARALVDEMVDAIMVQHFGYKRAPSRPKTNGRVAAHDGGGGGDRDWQTLTQNILTGRELHDSITVLAAKMIAAGTKSGAAINQLRALMEASTASKDERWRARQRDPGGRRQRSREMGQEAGAGIGRRRAARAREQAHRAFVFPRRANNRSVQPLAGAIIADSDLRHARHRRRQSLTRRSGVARADWAAIERQD